MPTVSFIYTNTYSNTNEHSFTNIFLTFYHSYDGGKSAMKFWEDGFYTEANTPIMKWTQGEPALVKWMMVAQHRGNCYQPSLYQPNIHWFLFSFFKNPTLSTLPRWICILDYVLKNKNSLNFTRDADWPPNHKTYFSFALPCLWKVIIHFLIWCRLSWNGRIGQSLTGIIRFHRHSRKKPKKYFVIGRPMCISGEIQGFFGSWKRNLLQDDPCTKLQFFGGNFSPHT